MVNKSDSISPDNKTLSRNKEQHIRLCLEKDVEYSKSNGFEKFDLINNPLPEIDFNRIDTSSSFLGKRISAPLIILPLTGGSKLSIKINKNLAKAARELGVVMSVGSQKLGLEDTSLAASYQVRDVAPDIPLLANLGAIYLNYGYGLKECEQAIDMIGADGLSLYLNPVQKMAQGGSNLNFEGLADKIAYICQHLEVPVVVKEVGFGLSPGAALSLKGAGVSILDVAGAGGTSWVKVTRHLLGITGGLSSDCFDEWGTPTADSLVSVHGAVKDLPLIASGGIRNGIDVAKALALGASYAGIALPVLAPAVESSEAVKIKMERMIRELKIAMFCCGAVNIDQLKKGLCIKKNSL